MIARFLILALLAMTAACAKPERSVDWGALADHIENSREPYE